MERCLSPDCHLDEEEPPQNILAHTRRQAAFRVLRGEAERNGAALATSFPHTLGDQTQKRPRKREKEPNLGTVRAVILFHTEDTLLERNYFFSVSEQIVSYSWGHAERGEEGDKRVASGH